MGAPTWPAAVTTRRRPGFSVTRKLPSGSGSTAQGFSRPSATTVVSKATLELTPQARVWSGEAGTCPSPLGERSSTGTHPAPAASVAAVLPVWDWFEPSEQAEKKAAARATVSKQTGFILDSDNSCSVSIGFLT